MDNATTHYINLKVFILFVDIFHSLKCTICIVFLISTQEIADDEYKETSSSGDTNDGSGNDLGVGSER